MKSPQKTAGQPRRLSGRAGCHYYSQEADITVSICHINQTVFICPGKLMRLIQPEDYKNCQVTKEYLQIEP